MWHIILLVVFHHSSLSTKNSSKSKTFSDSYVVYKHLDKIHYGIIQNIFFIEQQDRYLLKIQPLTNTNYDSLKIGSRVLINEHVVFGILSKSEVHLISSEAIIEKACFYNDRDTCYFARYPNFFESS